MKLLSWNVNGIRSILNKGFQEIVKKEDPDLLCIQEIKAKPEQVNLNLPQYPYHIWNAAVKPGYSGTAVFSKVQPLSISYGDTSVENDEGRIVTVELPAFYIVNVYTPNAQRGLARLPYRQEWDGRFLRYLQALERQKPVIFCGDLNVAHTEIDLARPKDNRFNAGFTDEERAGFSRILSAGFIDSFRVFNQQPGHYTWWSYMFQARQKNIGWRIDYVCLSERLKARLQESFIRPHIQGSDHCPVGIVLK